MSLLIRAGIPIAKVVSPPVYSRSPHIRIQSAVVDAEPAAYKLKIQCAVIAVIRACQVGTSVLKSCSRPDMAHAIQPNPILSAVFGS